MRVKIHLAVIPLFFVLAVLYLQACSVSGDSTETPSGTDNTPKLALATVTGTTALPADGTSSVAVQLTVTNANGQGIDNTPVTFTTTAGTLSVPNGTRSQSVRQLTTRANGGSTSVTASTNGSGVAQAILTSSTKAATATVRAAAMGFSVSLAIQFVGGAPTGLDLSATPSTVNAGETSIIRATVRDAN